MSGDGNNSRQSIVVDLLEELFEFCQSESLSEKGLREIIGLHGCNNDNDPNIRFFRAACRNEQITEGIIRCLLEYFPNAARHAGKRGQLPLHYICHNKNVTLGMVQLLIDAFPDSLRRKTKKGSMPLHKLCHNDDLDNEVGLEILKLLLERCPESVKHAARKGHSCGSLPIHIAAAIQSPEFCRVLIEAYPGSERMTDNLGLPPFHYACQCNTVATLEYLYQLYPESINVADRNGHHPIHHAIMGLKRRSNPKDGIEVVRFLLGCNPGALSSTGQIPLHIACLHKNVTLKTVQLLIDAFPDSVRHEDNKGRMSLHVLCGNNDLDEDVGLEILKLFLEKCPEAVRHVDSFGDLPIHFAAMNQSPEFCRVLIEAYPGSGRLTNGYGGLPFHYACHWNMVATAKYLYQLYPESINVADNKGFYPIHHAITGAEYRSPEAAIEMVQFLLDCDPGVVLQMRNGKSPLYWVCFWATNKHSRKLKAHLKVLQILYDAYPEAIIESDEVASNVGRFCQEVQTFINTQLTYAHQARDSTLMATRDVNGQLPLHKSLRDDVTLGSIKLLVNGNPSAICTVDNRGTIPLHVACQHHESPAVEFLINLNKDTLTTADREGNTALHYACRGANHEIIALLLDKYGSMSVSKRNKHNQLPVDFVLQNKNEVKDKRSDKFTESIYGLLRANPETLMHNDLEQAGSTAKDCILQKNETKRKIEKV